jgi:hypothetical protein
MVEIIEKAMGMLLSSIVIGIVIAWFLSEGLPILTSALKDASGLIVAVFSV